MPLGERGVRGPEFRNQQVHWPRALGIHRRFPVIPIPLRFPFFPFKAKRSKKEINGQLPLVPFNIFNPQVTTSAVPPVGSKVESTRVCVDEGGGFRAFQASASSRSSRSCSSSALVVPSRAPTSARSLNMGSLGVLIKEPEKKTRRLKQEGQKWAAKKKSAFFCTKAWSPKNGPFNRMGAFVWPSKCDSAFEHGSGPVVGPCPFCAGWPTGPFR